MHGGAGEQCPSASEAMTNTILLIHRGRILAEGNISHIRELIDEHPHKVYLRCNKPRLLGSICVEFEYVASVEFESMEKARQFYDSPAYEAIRGLRLSSAYTEWVFVDGLSAGM